MQRGLLGKVAGVLEAQMCVEFAFAEKVCVTGTHNGNIWIWQGNNLTKSVKAHNGPLYVIKTFNNSIFTGGKDKGDKDVKAGYVKEWDK